MSTYDATQKALGAHFAANVATPNNIPTVWPNQFAIPPGTNLEECDWMRVAVLWATSRPVVVQGTSGRYRTRGEMIVSIHTPGDSGAARANELADIVASTYRGAEFDAVTFETAEIRQAGVSGHWWQVNVHCPFYTDEVT